MFYETTEIESLGKIFVLVNDQNKFQVRSF